MAPTLSLCMIVKNNAEHIGESLASVADFVNEIIVTDTGSTDGTKDVIRRRFPRARILDFNHETHPAAFTLDSAAVWEPYGIPGPFTNAYQLTDFAAARQHGWDQATGDYVMWIDSDDVVTAASKLPAIVADMIKNNLNTVHLDYHYDHDQQGNVTCNLVRERIVRRCSQIHWSQPVHEILTGAEKCAVYDDVKIVHHREKWCPQPMWHHRNLKILSRAWDQIKREIRPEPRTLFYLGGEERFLFPERSTAHLREYVVRGEWDEERAIAHLIMGSTAERAGRIQEAFAEYAQSAVEFPWSPDGLLGLARCAYFRNDWQKCIEFTDRAIVIMEHPQPRMTTLMHNPNGRAVVPYLFLARSLAEMGNVTKAAEACRRGLAGNPADLGVQQAMRLYDEYLSGQIRRT